MPQPKEKVLSPAQQKANETKARKKAEAEALALAKDIGEQLSSPAPAPDGKAEVIATLVKQGFSYDDAVAMVNGEKKPQEKSMSELTKKLIAGDDSDLPPVPDVPEKQFPIVAVDMDTRPGLENYLFELDARLKELRDSDEAIYQISVRLPKKLYEFFVADTLREGVLRRDVNWTEEKHLHFLLKQRLATDPTKGGRVKPISSGPRSSYDAQSGGWS